MSTITIWLLLTFSAGHPATLIERFKDEAACADAARQILEPSRAPVVMCVRATVLYQR